MITLDDMPGLCYVDLDNNIIIGICKAKDFKPKV